MPQRNGDLALAASKASKASRRYRPSARRSTRATANGERQWSQTEGYSCPAAPFCALSNLNDHSTANCSGVGAETALFTLAKSQPEKSEATSDDEGDPACRLRHRPVPDDDGPLLKNPQQVEQRHHCEDHPSNERKCLCIHERSSQVLSRIALKEAANLQRTKWSPKWS